MYWEIVVSHVAILVLSFLAMLPLDDVTRICFGKVNSVVLSEDLGSLNKIWQ